MSDKPFNEQAVFLIDSTMELIKQILVKHSGAVLKEMHDQIVKRNTRISNLERDLAAEHKATDMIAEERDAFGAALKDARDALAKAQS